jgi:hypothetical protein
LILAAALAAAPAHAQEPGSPAPAGPETGVIVYPPAYFAAAQPNTAMDMIARVPGFTFDGGDSVRGFAGALGNVLIDGAPPASKSDRLEDVLRRIPASTVERIELIRGGAPGIDMQGRNVIVNVVRKGGAGRTGLIAFADQVFDDGRTAPAFRLEGSARWDGKSVDGSLLLFKFVDDGSGDGPRTRRDGSGAVIQDAYQSQEAGGYGVDLKGSGRTPLWGGELRANASFHNETYTFDLDDTDRLSGVRQQNGDVYKQNQGEVGLNWDYKLTPALTLQTLALQRIKKEDFTSEFEMPGFDARFTELDDSGESIVRGVLRWTLSDRWSFEGGGEAAFNWLQAYITYAENGVPVALPTANVRVEEQRGEAFVQGTWRPSPQLTLEAGSKFETSTLTVSGDASSEQSFFYPKPRVLLTWAPRPSDQLRLRFEREVGQLNFGDFATGVTFSTGSGAGDAGNPDLHPPQTWVAEASWERRFWGKGAAILTVRHKSIADAFDRVPVCIDNPPADGVCDQVLDAPGNIGEGTGQELAFNLNLPLERLGLKGAEIRGQATWRRSEVTDPTTGESRRLSGQRPMDAELHFTQDLPALKTTWGIDAFKGWEEVYYRLDEVRRVSAETWVTAYAEYKPRPNLTIRFEAHNLLGRDFIRDRSVFAGPRDSAPLAYREHRPLDFGPFFYMRIRKTFG